MKLWMHFLPYRFKNPIPFSLYKYCHELCQCIHLSVCPSFQLFAAKDTPFACDVKHLVATATTFKSDEIQRAASEIENVCLMLWNNRNNDCRHLLEQRFVREEQTTLPRTYQLPQPIGKVLITKTTTSIVIQYI